jgi:hypothetical protein
MSQTVISQKIQRTCDGCGIVKEYELVDMRDTTIVEMQDWYTVIREVFFQGEFRKIMVQACSLACTPAAAVKLALPKVQDEPVDNIDLASLRTSNLN